MLVDARLGKVQIVQPLRPIAAAGGHRPHRHVLEVGLVGGGAAGQEGGGVGVAAVLVVGVVVFHLVVVPGADPGVGGVAGPQVGIELVQGVALAVCGQGAGYAARVWAHDVLGVGALVNVVTHKQHQRQILAGDVGVGGVIPLFVMLARGQRQPQATDRSIGRGCGAGAAHRALCRAALEAVPVRPVGAQALRPHMHAPATPGMGDELAALHPFGQRLIRKNLIADCAELVGTHARLRFKKCLLLTLAGRLAWDSRARVEACPQQHRIGPWLATGHTQGKRVGPPLWPGQLNRGPGGQAHRRQCLCDGGQGEGGVQKMAALHARHWNTGVGSVDR